MKGRVAGHDVNDVDANGVGFSKKARNQKLGGGRHPLQAPKIKRSVGSRDGGPGLHLDEGEDGIPSGNKVDFADRCPNPLGKHFPSASAQESCGLRFCAAAAPLGFDPSLAQRPSSSARS